MKRVAAFLVVLAMIVASCGGGDDEAEPTTTSAPAAPEAPTTNDGPSGADEPANTLPQPTVPEDGDTGEGGDNGEMEVVDDPGTDTGQGSSTEFCAFIADVDETQDGIDFGFDTDAFRQAMEDTVAALERAQDLAPGEIEDDVDFVLGTFLDFISLLEEYDYNFMALGTQAADDPRLLAFDEAEFEAAVQRIGDFCGVDLDAGGGEVDPGTGSGGETEIPGDIPEALIPPNVVETFDIGGGSIIISTTASFAVVVDFYTELLGNPMFVNDAEMAGVWQGQFEGTQYSVSLSGDGETVEVLIAVLG